MQANRSLGVAFAFACLIILGVMPILASDRPAGHDGLTFTILLTFWQLVCAIPLTLGEFATKRPRIGGESLSPGRRTHTIVIALVTGAMFGISTYMYVVAAGKAGPVSMAIALQAYPLFAIILEAVFLGKRKSPTELAFTAVILVALVYLTTGGTFSPAQISWWSVYALGIPLIWSIAHLLLRSVLTTTTVTPNQVTVSRLLISGAFLLMIYAIVGEPGSLRSAIGDFELQKAAFVLGLAYYAELILWFYAMRHIDVSVGSSVTVPAPAVTLLIAVAFTGAPVAAYQVAALAAIVIGMYGLLLAGHRRQARAA